MIRDLVVGQSAHVVGEKRQTVAAREQHIYGEADSERLGDFTKTGLRCTSDGREIFG